jgi:ABC-2 type transport system permease protein
VGADTSEAARQVTQQLEDAAPFDVTAGTEDAELDALRSGDRAVVLVFSPGSSPQQTRADIYWDEANPQQGQLALNAVQQFLQQVNADLAGGVRPIEINVQAVTSSELRYIDYFVPGIVAMSVMQSGMIGLASAFVTYRERGILRRIKATPFPLWQFITARLASQLVIAVVQAAILMLIGRVVFDLRISGNLLSVLVMVTLGALAFLALGFAIAAFARNQEAADSLANALSFPMMFLGGVFFPVDAAPEWVQVVTRVIPLRYFADALRDLMVRGDPLTGEWVPMLVLLGTGAAGFALALRFFRWESART